MIAWVSSNLQNSKNRTSEIHSFSIILDFTSENSGMQPLYLFTKIKHHHHLHLHDIITIGLYSNGWREILGPGLVYKPYKLKCTGKQSKYLYNNKDTITTTYLQLSYDYIVKCEYSFYFNVIHNNNLHE